MTAPAHAPRTTLWERLDDRLADAALAVSVMLVISLVIAIDPVAASPVEGIVCAAVFGALLLARRRFPVLVLAVTILLIFGYYAAGFPPIGMVLPAVGALFSVAEMRRTGWGIGCAAVLIAVSTFFRLEDADPAAALSGFAFVTELALAAASLALGVAVRLAREARERSARIAELTAAEEALAAEARMHAERMRIARDLHDTIGHTLSVASLHAAVAAEATGSAPRSAALAEVRGATSEALRELRRTVKVLRADTADAPGAALGLASREEVFAAARAAGLHVADEVTVPAEALPRPVDAAAHRILQESITNVLRHADATQVRVQAELTGGVLDLRITDDGHGGQLRAAPEPTGQDQPAAPKQPTAGPRSQQPTAGPSSQQPGAGITGMRERAELLGGTLTAGPGANGFTVHARLPVRDQEET